jgi:hypothetical protein
MLPSLMSTSPFTNYYLRLLAYLITIFRHPSFVCDTQFSSYLSIPFLLATAWSCLVVSNEYDFEINLTLVNELGLSLENCPATE